MNGVSQKMIFLHNKFSIIIRMVVLPEELRLRNIVLWIVNYVFIYYSGHGEIEAEKAYWVPKDGSKKWGYDDWIAINYIDIYIRDKIKAHHIAVLVDSCYVGGKFKGLNLLDNMTEEDSRIFAKQLVTDLNSRSRSVLSSGSTGPVSDTGAGTNHGTETGNMIITKLEDLFY